jgi:hypothetical protein
MVIGVVMVLWMLGSQRGLLGTALGGFIGALAAAGLVTATSEAELATMYTPVEMAAVVVPLGIVALVLAVAIPYATGTVAMVCGQWALCSRRPPLLARVRRSTSRRSSCTPPWPPSSCALPLGGWCRTASAS